MLLGYNTAFLPDEAFFASHRLKKPNLVPWERPQGRPCPWAPLWAAANQDGERMIGQRINEFRLFVMDYRSSDRSSEAKWSSLRFYFGEALRWRYFTSRGIVRTYLLFTIDLIPSSVFDPSYQRFRWVFWEYWPRHCEGYSSVASALLDSQQLL